jgi:hypothetical protein
MKNDRLDIRVSKEQKELLQNMAKSKNMDLTDFLTMEFFKTTSNNFVSCPNCQAILFDKRLPFKGEITVYCAFCQRPFIYKFKL